MRSTKDDPYICELRSLSGGHLPLMRDELNPTQTELADAFGADKHPPFGIERGQSLHYALPLLFYLCYSCKDPMAVIAECQKILDKYVPNHHIP